jgi:hypothetical protein
LGQLQNFDHYGRALGVFEITEISRTKYSERMVASIDPEFRNGLNGIHHMSWTNGTLVFDHDAYFVGRFPGLFR